MGEFGDDKTVDIHYLKSHGFREIACDGTIGGETPNDKIWLAFYTERFPLPRVSRHNVVKMDKGYQVEMPGEKVDGREGIIRNIEFGVYMSREEAAQLAEWLKTALENPEGKA